MILEGAINMYEKKRAEGKPVFFFIVTIQNHGGYSKIPDPTIHLMDDMKNNEASTYLTGIKKTDDSVKKIIEYFSSVKEPVVIFFYGDHYPHIPSFWKQIVGVPDIGLFTSDQQAGATMTPYFIWANYDIPSETMNSSLCYMSGKLMEVAGFPRTTYMNFLQDMKKHIPRLNPFVIMDEKGNWHSRGDNDDVNMEYLSIFHDVEYYMITEYRKKKKLKPKHHT